MRDFNTFTRNSRSIRILLNAICREIHLGISRSEPGDGSRCRLVIAFFILAPFRSRAFRAPMMLHVYRAAPTRITNRIGATWLVTTTSP